MSTGTDQLSLDQTRRRLEAVLNNATVAIFLMDDRQHCVYMNPAAEVLTGYELEEVLNLNKPLHDIVHHTHPDGRPFPMKDCPIDRAFPEYANTQGREVFVHKDGSFYPVAFNASPIMDEASMTIGTVIEARNITAELEKERELEDASNANRLLLQEVNHRVKNSLQLVISLLDLQAGETDDRQAKSCLKDARNRVRVIASIHSRLYESQQYDRVEISAYLKQLVEATLKSTGRPDIALRFEGCADFTLPISSAVSLALIVSELVVNAAKHAFNERGGELTLRVTNLDSSLVIEVGDDGAGLPQDFSIDRRGSLGMTLVAALAFQIRANFTFGDNGPGTVFRIEVPC